MREWPGPDAIQDRARPRRKQGRTRRRADGLAPAIGGQRVAPVALRAAYLRGGLAGRSNSSRLILNAQAIANIASSVIGALLARSR